MFLFLVSKITLEYIPMFLTSIQLTDMIDLIWFDFKICPNWETRYPLLVLINIPQHRNVTMILADEYSPRDQRETPYGGHVSHKDNTQGLINHTNCWSVQDISSMDTIPRSRYIPRYPRSSHQRTDCQVHPVPHTENTVPLSRFP